MCEYSSVRCVRRCDVYSTTYSRERLEATDYNSPLGCCCVRVCVWQLDRFWAWLARGRGFPGHRYNSLYLCMYVFALISVLVSTNGMAVERLLPAVDSHDPTWPNISLSLHLPISPYLSLFLSNYAASSIYRRLIIVVPLRYTTYSTLVYRDMYTVQCTVFSVHCTPYNDQWTVYIVHSTYVELRRNIFIYIRCT